jgi:hypothetical protein
MSGVAAGWHIAAVERVSAQEGAVTRLVDDAVNVPHAPIESDHAIAMAVRGPQPEPAAGGIWQPLDMSEDFS